LNTIGFYTAARELVRKHEGLRLKVYRDTAGKLTIGYGRNLDDKGISNSEAETLLDNDLKEVYGDLETIFSKTIWDEDINRLAALVSMRFNLGPAGFRKFKKMIEAVRNRDWNEAANQAKDSQWYSQVGVRGQEIVDLLKGK
jgi:lysozyme